MIKKVLQNVLQDIILPLKVYFYDFDKIDK